MLACMFDLLNKLIDPNLIFAKVKAKVRNADVTNFQSVITNSKHYHKFFLKKEK